MKHLITASILALLLTGEVASKPLYDPNMCKEVTIELYIAVELGYLRPKDAAAISKRCYDRYGGN